jgi:threonyl-tRNA synthetase
MIHRAPFGSLERFVAVLIEHCAGNFPLWLSPEQFAVLPISEKYQDYAQQVYDRLVQAELRGSLDSRDEKIGRKIRDSEMSKVPYMLIVGEKEQENSIVSVRKHGEGDVGSMPLEAFIRSFNSQVADMMESAR